MSADLPASAKKVQAALSALGVACVVSELADSTRTAVEAAKAVGCDVEQIAKSLVFKAKTSGKAVLVIASGKNRVNEKLIEAALGEPIGKADADFVREQTGYAIGGVPPVGHVQPIRTFLDRDLLTLGDIWAAAGTPHCLFRITSDDLVKATNGQILQIA